IDVITPQSLHTGGGGGSLCTTGTGAAAGTGAGAGGAAAGTGFGFGLAATFLAGSGLATSAGGAGSGAASGAGAAAGAAAGGGLVSATCCGELGELQASNAAYAQLTRVRAATRNLKLVMVIGSSLEILAQQFTGLRLKRKFRNRSCRKATTLLRRSRVLFLPFCDPAQELTLHAAFRLTLLSARRF